MRRLFASLALGAALVASAAPAQQKERTPAPAGEAKPVGFLPEDAVDFRGVLPAPPAQGSPEDREDGAEISNLQTVGPARWKTALADDAYLYPRFEAAYGEPIDRAHDPVLVNLLNRAMKDVANPVFRAKAEYRRLRPYQRFQLIRVCGEAQPPAPDLSTQERSSYPSGHAAYGWLTALILAEIAPDRAGPILARGRDYGVSRLVCGVHFPSDVRAGQAMAQVVFARLMRDPVFAERLRAIEAGRVARDAGRVTGKAGHRRQAH